MRKALIGILMAATVATPVAAQERPARRDGFVERVQRTVGQDRSIGRQSQRAERPQPRMERQPQRADRPQRQVERQPQRTERPQQRQFERGAGQEQRQYQRVQREGQRADRPERNPRPGRPQGTPVEVRGPAASWPGQQERANRVVNRSLAQDRRDGQYERRDNRRDWRDDRRPATRHNWDRNWRNDSRYDWQRYRYSNRNLFSVGRYYAPFDNYRYSRFSIGLRIGQPFYSDRYWLNDPWRYRLPPAYAGTRWVRYYDDVLLVDTYSGQVLDVIYDFFW